MKKRLLLFIAGIMLVLLVVSFFGFEEVIGALVHANPLYIAAALGLQFVGLLLLGLRQKVLGGGKASLRKSFRVAMSGNFVNLIMPGPAIGGETLKAYMLRSTYGRGKAIAVIAVDDFIEILGTLLVVFFAVVFFAPMVAPGLKTVFAAFILIVILIMTGILKVLLTPKWLKRVVHWVIKRISKYQHINEKDYASMFYRAFRVLLKKKIILSKALALTLSIKIIEFAVLYLSFASLGVSLPLREIVVLWSIIVVFLFIPWLPGSLGLVEFGAASTLVSLGLASTTAASGMLINRAISLWFVLFVGAVAIYHARTKGELAKNTRLGDVK
ncbi:MAG TPA: flippase-like domain-containing protein [archaeon]|nr:flippase-like domain-containing protein [archaeon]